MTLTLDLRVPPCVPASEVAAFIRQCEEAGFSGVGLLDSQLLVRDVFVTMALAAQNTSRIRLASAVTNPVTRHLSVLASAARTVVELAPDRVEIWIGSGYSAVRTIGVAPATVEEMRQAVLTLKRLLTGEDVSFSGVTSRMRHGGPDVPPIYIAATGPKTIELAGEVADGVVLQIGIHRKAVEAALHHLAAGAMRARRSIDELELVFCATTIIRRDLQEAREMARPLCVQRLMEKHHARWLQEAGIELGERELPKELWDLYPDVPHAEDWEKAKRLCAFLPEETLAQICDAIGLIGTPEHCARRLRKAEEDGLKHVYLMTSDTYRLAYQELKAFQEVIFPALTPPFGQLTL